MMEPFAQSDFVQYRDGIGFDISRRPPLNQGWHARVLERRKFRQEMMKLKHEPDSSIAKFRVRRVGRSNIPIICRSVLFPAPDAPMMASSSPRRISRLIPLSTVRSCSPILKVLYRPLIPIMAYNPGTLRLAFGSGNQLRAECKAPHS